MTCTDTGFVDNSSTAAVGFIPELIQTPIGYVNNPQNVVGFVSNSCSPSGGGGGGSGAIVDIGSFVDPQIVTSAIAVPDFTESPRAMVYVESDSGMVQAALENGSGTQELYITGTSDTNFVQLAPSGNFRGSGKINLLAGTILYLRWIDSVTQWFEVSRNEIY